jgi:hypothetical protein
MRWITRRHIHVNRTATAWLIHRFVDPEGEIVFVEPEAVSAIQRQEWALGFDAPGARYPHKDEQGRCSFEQLVVERLGHDAALRRLARIVHGADFLEEASPEPESRGLWAISRGFTDVGRDDPDIVAHASFLYDALYAHLKRAEARSAVGSNHA